MCGSKDTSGTGGSRNTLYAWRQVGFELRLWFEVAIIQRKNLASGSYICCQQFGRWKHSYVSVCVATAKVWGHDNAMPLLCPLWTSPLYETTVMLRLLAAQRRTKR